MFGYLHFFLPVTDKKIKLVTVCNDEISQRSLYSNVGSKKQ